MKHLCSPERGATLTEWSGVVNQHSFVQLHHKSEIWVRIFSRRLLTLQFLTIYFDGLLHFRGDFREALLGGQPKRIFSGVHGLLPLA